MATAFRDAAKPLPFIHPDDMPDLYALPGYGTCMMPVIRDGALVVCDKRQQPEPGDSVVVHFTRDYARRQGVPGAIKRLKMALPPPEICAVGNALIVVEQINPRRTFTFYAADVLAVHKVVGIGEATSPGSAQYRPSEGAPR